MWASIPWTTGPDELERSFALYDVAIEGFKWSRPDEQVMSAAGPLDEAAAREVEEQLTTTHRQQINRRIPIPLPRPDFWNAVSRLLQSIDLDLHEAVRKHGFDLRVQNLQRRQATIRRVASELARRRLVAMMQHASSQSLRSPSPASQPNELPSLDWSRHDPAEREFYTTMKEQMDRFKLAVDWASMQNGLPAEAAASRPAVADLAPAGTTQLDAFTGSKEGLTGSPPPALAFEDPTPQDLQDLEMDEEERLLSERLDDWPEEAYLFEQGEATPKPKPKGKHAAALELAPAPDSEPTETPVAEASSADVPSASLSRVRILVSMEDAILGPAGEEIVLSSGDVHLLTADVADILVASGVAETAEL